MASVERRAGGRRSSRGVAPEVVTIFWRDIPAQVNGQAGRERHQVLLSAKFQRAVDRAKRKAKIYTADDDIAQWRRTSTACEGDIAAAAAAEAARLEAAYTRDYLGRLAYAGGNAADVADVVVDPAELRALEELDDELADGPEPSEPDAPGPGDPGANGDGEHDPGQHDEREGEGR